MIFLTQEMFENKNQFIGIIEKEKIQINSMIESQKALKSIILNWMQNFAFSDEKNYHDDIDTILNFLSNLKNSLKLCNESLDLLHTLSKSIDKMILDLNNSNTIEPNFCNNYNSMFLKSNETLLKNSIEIEKFFSSIIPLSIFTSPDLKNTDNVLLEESNNVNMLDSTKLEPAEKAKILEMPIDENLVQPVDNTNHVENTLIISEMRGKVFLPYTISDLNNLLEQNHNEYTSLQDIIDKKYTLPIDLFKTPAISRFRESFRLIRRKEKKSIREAFDLGMELFFNYNLHPAIISACRNSDELDIYLDYLENNETHKFDCFKIIFEIPPVLLKK